MSRPYCRCDGEMLRRVLLLWTETRDNPAHSVELRAVASVVVDELGHELLTRAQEWRSVHDSFMIPTAYDQRGNALTLDDGGPTDE